MCFRQLHGILATAWEEGRTVTSLLPSREPTCLPAKPDCSLLQFSLQVKMPRLSLFVFALAAFLFAGVPFMGTPLPSTGPSDGGSSARRGGVPSSSSSSVSSAPVEVLEVSDDDDDVFVEEEWHRYASSAADLSRLRRMTDEEREGELRQRWDHALLRLSWLEAGIISREELTSFERLVEVEDDHHGGPPVFPRRGSPSEESDVKEEKMRTEVVSASSTPSLSNPLLLPESSPTVRVDLGSAPGIGVSPSSVATVRVAADPSSPAPESPMPVITPSLPITPSRGGSTTLPSSPGRVLMATPSSRSSESSPGKTLWTCWQEMLRESEREAEETGGWRVRSSRAGYRLGGLSTTTTSTASPQVSVSFLTALDVFPQ